MMKKKTVGITILCLVIVALLAMILLITINQKDVPEMQESSFELIPVSTPYCTLRMPGNFRDMLLTTIDDGDPYTVRFYGQMNEENPLPLFDIWFSESETEESIGCIHAADQTLVYVGLTTYEVEIPDAWSEEEKNTVYAMQEVLNDILENMNWAETEEAPMLQATEESAAIIIDTPYIPLTYPIKWIDYLELEESSSGEMYQVDFFGQVVNKEAQHLFTIQFGAESDLTIGVVYNEAEGIIPVNVIVGTYFPDNTWTEDEKNIIYAMREDLNYLIEHMAIEMQ